MDERICFVATEAFVRALDNYCNDRSISKSSFIKDLVGSKLINENYLKKRGRKEK
jgi:hypothetical protein